MNKSDAEEIEFYRNLMKERKRCFIPYCPNHKSEINSNVVFVKIPDNLKAEWFQLVGRENCPKRNQYCCENHINLQEDLQNYETWNSTKYRPIMRPNTRLKNYEKPEIKVFHEDVPSCSGTTTDMIVEMQVSRAVQTTILTYSNKCIQTAPLMEDKSTYFRGRKITRCSPRPTPFLEEDIQEQSTTECAEDTNPSSTSNTMVLKDFSGRDHLLKLINNDPKMYLGVPKSVFFIIEHISKLYKFNSIYLIIALFKLKHNDSFSRLSGQFQLSRNTIQTKYHRSIEILASFFQNFVFLPTPEQILRNLPLVFRIRYSNVQVIIDCLEIEIEKPSDPVKQAQTWSQYKSCNTLKYLIACTPNGFVTFISKGYGGRLSDKAITLKSGFIDTLPPNCMILADRGFKEIESYLSTKNIKLLRPPSVSQTKNMTKTEAVTSKVIASLRVHVERLIRRVREFRTLKPHSNVNYNHVRYLDEYIIIACGLINFQKPLIKEY